MKNRIKILVLISVFLCSYTNLIAKEKTVKTDIQKELLELSSKNSVLEKNIQALSLEKTTLQNKVSHLQTQQTQLQKQYTDLEEIAKFNIEQYHDKTTNMIGWTLAILTLFLTTVVGIVGIYIPISQNKIYTKNFDEKIKECKDEIKALRQLEKDLSIIKTDVDNDKSKINAIQEQILKDKIAAKESAKQAKISELFSEAYNEEDLQKQLDLYSKVIQLDSLNYGAYNNRALIYKRLHKYTQALCDLDRAIEIDPKSIEAYINRGFVFSLLGKEKLAYDDYNTILAIDPECAHAYNQKADYLYKMGKYEEALEQINIAIELKIKGIYYVTRAEIYTAMKKFDLALNDFESALKLNDKELAIYENRAKCYRAMAEENSEESEKYISLAEADEEIVKKGKELDAPVKE